MQLAEYDDNDFNEGFKQRCYYKVKLNSTSYMHTVWLPSQYASESSKYNAFYRKLASWHGELNSVSSLVDNLECKLKQQANFWPLPESIVSLIYKSEPTQKTEYQGVIKAHDWKYCLVKW